MKISEMIGIGKVNEEKLNEAGIMNAEQLKKTGAKKAFLLVQEKVDKGACLHLLYGLEAAIQGIPKKELSAETKKDLTAFFNAHKIDI